MLMAAKLGRMVTYLEGILPIKAYNRGRESSREKQKPFCLL